MPCKGFYFDAGAIPCVLFEHHVVLLRRLICAGCVENKADYRLMLIRQIPFHLCWFIMFGLVISTVNPLFLT